MAGRQIRHGTKATLPTLSEGELDLCTDTREVYVGSSVGNIRIHGECATPEMFGVVDGVDDHVQIQAAVDSADTVLLNKPTYNVPTAITLPDHDLNLISQKRSLLTTAGVNDIFSQTNHRHNKFDGLAFGGGGRGIRFNCINVDGTEPDYDIVDCHFLEDHDVYGISLVGTRPGTISRCWFRIGNGVYLQKAVLPTITNSNFDGMGTGAVRGHYAIFYDGDDPAVAQNCGLTISNNKILGYEQGVRIQNADDFILLGNVIDYNDFPVLVFGQEGGKIIGNYIAGDLANPNITIGLAGAEQSKNILISGNHLSGYYAGGNTFDAIALDRCNNIGIVGNNIAFWTRYGISYDTCSETRIIGNSFQPRLTFGVKDIFATADDSTNLIIANKFSALGISTQYAMLLNNIRGAGSISWNNYHLAVSESLGLAAGKALLVNWEQVIGARVVDARADDAINAGAWDATTAGVLEALRDAAITHGWIKAA